MEPHQQRVGDEESALAEKIVKLVAFISTRQIFEMLPEREKILLKTSFTLCSATTAFC